MKVLLAPVKVLLVPEFSSDISREIAAAGKIFTEGEFIKICMLGAVSLICPSEFKKILNVSLLHTTVQRRGEDISDDIINQLHRKAKEFSFYSLAVNDRRDSTDTAQLLVFIKGIGDNSNAFEELADLQSMEGWTSTKNICSEIVDCVTIKLYIWLESAPTLIQVRAKKKQSDSFAAGAHWKKGYHSPCVIHQQLLCIKVLELDDVMSVVV